MNKCRKNKDMMIEALYGELDPAEKKAFDDHLRSCAECASEYSVLGATLRIMDSRKRPDPGPEFWDGYWDRLSKRMEKESAPRSATATETPVRIPLGRRIGRLFPSLPRWSYQAAAAAALVVVGILIGRNIFSPQTPLTMAQRGPAEAAVIPVSDPAVDRAHDYLERSKLLLLGLVNYDAENDDPYALDMPRRKELSRELVTEAAYIKGSLAGSGQARLRELIGDLEVILLQIANLEAEQDLEAVEFVQRGVEEKGIFLKIDLTQMARNARGSAPKASGHPDKPII